MFQGCARHATSVAVLKTSNGRQGTKTVAAMFLARRPGGSALAVLEALAGAGLTVLLTLDLAVVTGQEAGLLQGAAALRIFRGQGAGDAVAHRVRLRAVAATGDGCSHVVLVEQLEQFERLAGDHAAGLTLEVLFDVLTVDGDLTRTGADPNTSNGGLALTSGVRLSFGHYLSVPRKITVSERQNSRLLCLVGVLGR